MARCNWSEAIGQLYYVSTINVVVASSLPKAENLTEHESCLSLGGLAAPLIIWSRK
jgi:hypothetical protein